MSEAYKDKYLSLRDENHALKQKSNEQKETIKRYFDFKLFLSSNLRLTWEIRHVFMHLKYRMYTKLSMIEETIKKKKENDGAGAKFDKDANELIDDLRRRNIALKKKVSLMIEIR